MTIGPGPSRSCLAFTIVMPTKPAVPVEAQGMALRRLVEVHGLLRRANVQVQHVDIGVVVDPIEGGVPNGDVIAVISGRTR